jgi:hypothetical protein
MNSLAITDPLSALREFDGNTARADRDVRVALHSDCAGFLGALLDECAFRDDDPGFQFALGILLKTNALAPAIATPSITSFAQAWRLTRCILELNHNFINVLLTALLTRHDMTGPACALRVLDLVGEFPAHPLNWRSLMRIHEDGDKATKMKCVTLLARLRFADSAGIASFKRSEPRVRANIIEALWGVEREETSACLELAIDDEDNRVAGNACLALYNTGDARALARLAEMLRSPEPSRRITAAWVIGQCRDGRFAGRLLEGLRGELPALRRNSIASLARIEPVPTSWPTARAPDREDIGLYFVSAPPGPGAGERIPGGSNPFELWLYVTGQGGGFAPHLRPVDFFVWAGTELLLEYSVEELRRTDDAAVAIVYPAGSPLFESALRDSLANKPPGQSWAFNTYGTSQSQTEDSAVPRFEPDTHALTALLDSGPPSGGDMAGVVNRVLSAEWNVPERHLVLISEAPGTEADAWAAACEEKEIRYHGWRLGENADASGSPGAGVIGRDEEQWALVWPHFVASLGSRYTLRTRQMPTAVAIRNTGTRPARFSGRIDLMKGGRNA